MTCRTCGRQGDCRVCCCVHRSHVHALPNQAECPRCRHTTHGDPFLSPQQTNPTAGTPEDAAAQLDMAGDLTFNRDDEGEA